MSFEILNKETVWNKRGKPPVLRISKNGHIRLSSKAVEILGIEIGSKLSFMIDSRDKGVIYFYCDEEKGIPLVEINKHLSGNGYQVCCRQLALKLLSFIGIKNNVTFDVTAEKCETPHGSMWFVQKDKIHTPIKWRKKEL